MTPIHPLPLSKLPLIQNGSNAPTLLSLYMLLTTLTFLLPSFFPSDPHLPNPPSQPHKTTWKVDESDSHGGEHTVPQCKDVFARSGDAEIRFSRTRYIKISKVAAREFFLIREILQ